MATSESDRILPYKCHYCGQQTLRRHQAFEQGLVKCMNPDCSHSDPATGLNFIQLIEEYP